MSRSASLRPPLPWIFLLACLVPLTFALYTDHAWEDYYITYRSSKNLATGHGLVFNPGERLQTFTSPLGVLLPTLASLLTGNASDRAALWIFRAMSILAFGGAAAFLGATARRLAYPSWSVASLLGALLLDAKSVDFAINGMETAFLLLAFAYSFWAMFGAARRPALHLGLAWGGLMWVRPDSFIYIGLFAAAVWAFNRESHTGASRAAWLNRGAVAAGIAAAVYLPWLIFAWSYYGSPVPHTIVAKSAYLAAPRTMTGFLASLPAFLTNAWSDLSTLNAVSMPAYVLFGGWPGALQLGARGVATFCAFAWLLPRLRTETRAASFTFLGAHLYLSYFPPFAYPWYLCLPALLGALVISGVLTTTLQSLHASQRPRRVVQLVHTGIAVTVAVALGASAWLTLAAARQLKAQQALIETGTRRRIGEWLREHARPDDTVFLESLGYIGYFSQLKTLDVPGLSSRESVAALHRAGRAGWGAMIQELKPVWLVLRPGEAQAISQRFPGLLEVTYQGVRAWDVSAQVSQLDVQGRAYLEYDRTFFLFQRR